MQLALRLEGLTRLSLRRLGPRVTNLTLVPLLLRNGGSLHHLALPSIAGLSDAALSALVHVTRAAAPSAPASASSDPMRPLLRLRSLDLSFCRGVSNEGVGQVVDSAPSLRRLVVWGCSQLPATLFDGHR